MFQDRKDAAKKLVKKMKESKIDFSNAVVIALPRGGVPIAYEISRQFDIRMDILSVKKIGFPGNPELALGAVTEYEARYINEPVRKMSGLSDIELDILIKNQISLARKKSQYFRFGHELFEIKDKVVILVDDGIATGSTVIASIEQLKDFGASEIYVVTPIAPREVIHKISEQVDHVIYLDCPSPFDSVGRWYETFEQVRDTEVRELYEKNLELFNKKNNSINIDDLNLIAHVSNVADPKAIILMIDHGVKNFIIKKLNKDGFSTIYFQQKKHSNNSFISPQKLLSVTNWLVFSEYFDPLLPIGLYCHDEGASSAFIVAANDLKSFSFFAICSLDASLDKINREVLRKIKCPTLLLVSDKDKKKLVNNKRAHEQLPISKLEMITMSDIHFDNGSHIEEIAEKILEWFNEHVLNYNNTWHERKYYSQISDELQ